MYNQYEMYEEHTINSIERKRRISIDNSHRIDLYSNDDFIEIMKWFDDLIFLIKKNPPRGYVNTIFVHQKEGQITSIEYDLCVGSNIPLDLELLIVY